MEREREREKDLIYTPSYDEIGLERKWIFFFSCVRMPARDHRWWFELLAPSYSPSYSQLILVSLIILPVSVLHF